MIGIIDYGSGNIQAIRNIYKRLKIKTFIVKDPQDVSLASKLILPGVGAFDEAIGKLDQSGLRRLRSTTRSNPELRGVECRTSRYSGSKPPSLLGRGVTTVVRMTTLGDSQYNWSRTWISTASDKPVPSAEIGSAGTGRCTREMGSLRH